MFRNQNINTITCAMRDGRQRKQGMSLPDLRHAGRRNGVFSQRDGRIVDIVKRMHIIKLAENKAWSDIP